ncbi:MAG TPA: aminoglycoside adenylyltransferase family protein [Candidatus Saccharimonadales bacterium]|nr:aminoglycoside adenylyltransferase family protein [Candidatus Saccharimonadales bacterium]
MPDLSPGTRAQIDTVVELARAVFGDAAHAAYLYGSAVRGGLKPDSDLDILLVLERRTTDAERRALIGGLLERSRSRKHPDRRHLEVTAVVMPDLQPWVYPPPMELQYGDWWRTEFQAGHFAPWTSPNPDLAVLLTSVREEGVPLFGPPAADVIAPVSRDDLIRAVRDVIPELLPGLEDHDTRNSLLTLARIWFTLSTGRIEAKDVAATWALERLPDGTGEALRLARAGYLGEANDTWDEPGRAAARTDWHAMLGAIETADAPEDR